MMSMEKGWREESTELAGRWDRGNTEGGMGGFVRRIPEVAGWTLLSRVLGLLRDILLFASLGSGLWNSAFILAFTLPNLFRRLLGEGALTSSAIPVLAQTLERRGAAATHQLLNALVVRVGGGLLLLSVLVIGLLGLVDGGSGLAERWLAGAQLGQWLFPYVVFICVGALFCGALNVFGRFTLAALNQVWLNLAMIGVLVAGLWTEATVEERVWWLCGGVLAGGLLQLLIPMVGLRKSGWRATVVGRGRSDELDRLVRLFLPALLGAAIFQVNILVARLLAFSLNDTATGLLYLANRLVELPLGVFAIAVTTVVFPELSRLHAARDPVGFGATYREGLRFILGITLPAMVGLQMLSVPILGLLFEWGYFGSGDVAAARPVLLAAAAGLPFFAWSTLLTRGYYARQEMRVPVRLAGLNLVLNLGLGLWLMQIWGAVGLALANSLAGLLHCVALRIGFPLEKAADGQAERRDGRALLAGLGLMVLVLLGGRFGIHALMEVSKARHLVEVLLLIPLAVVVYGGGLALCGHSLVGRLRRRFGIG